VQGLKTGRFGWVFSGRELRREANPKLFWSAAATFAAITALSLSVFADEARRFAI